MLTAFEFSASTAPMMGGSASFFASKPPVMCINDDDVAFGVCADIDSAVDTVIVVDGSDVEFNSGGASGVDVAAAMSNERRRGRTYNFTLYTIFISPLAGVSNGKNKQTNNAHVSLPHARRNISAHAPVLLIESGRHSLSNFFTSKSRTSSVPMRTSRVKRRRTKTSTCSASSGTSSTVSCTSPPKLDDDTIVRDDASLSVARAW